MTLITVRGMIRRRWWIVSIPLALGVIATLASFAASSSDSAIGFRTEIRYSAAQELILPQRDGDYQDVWLASELTVNAFSDWIRSSSFRHEISALIGGESVNIASLGIAADNARSIGVIYFSHPDSAALQAIANAAIAVLSQRNQVFFPQLGGEAAQVTILDAPVITPLPPSITNRVAPLIRIAVGLFVGLVLAFFAEFLDQTVHEQDDLRRLGLPVIASIPRNRTGS